MPDRQQVAKLIEELDPDSFEVRTRAQEQLSNLGGTADAQLRQALEGATSLEQRTNLFQLLQKSTSGVGYSPEIQREIRAITVLSRIEATSAQALLQEIAADPVESARRTAARQFVPSLATP